MAGKRIVQLVVTVSLFAQTIPFPTGSKVVNIRSWGSPVKSFWNDQTFERLMKEPLDKIGGSVILRELEDIEPDKLSNSSSMKPVNSNYDQNHVSTNMQLDKMDIFRSPYGKKGTQPSFNSSGITNLSSFKKNFDETDRAGLRSMGKKHFNEIDTPGFDKRNFDEIDRAGFRSMDRRNFNEIDRDGFQKIDKRNFDEIDRAGFRNMYKRNFDEIDRAGFRSMDKRNFDEIDAVGFGKINKRNMDQIDRAGFGSMFKRNFDEIDRTDFRSMFKRNFDEIDRAGFGNIGKRDMSGIGRTIDMNNEKRNFDEIDRSGFNSIGKRDLNGMSVSALNHAGYSELEK